MYRSQFMPQADAIGTLRFFPESGTTIVDSGNGEWLRTGLAKTTSGYPTASALENLKVSGLVGAFGASIVVVSIATDGNGVFVACQNASTSLYISTNGGLTWQTANSNLAGSFNAVSVAFGGGKFVCVGNSASAISYSYATAANIVSSPTTAWTQVSQTTIGGGTGTANSVKIAYGGGKFVAIAGSSGTTGAIGYSTTGTSFTAANTSQALTNASWPVYSASKWLIGSTNGTTGTTSTDGITWSNATLPVNINGSFTGSASTFLVNARYTSTDGSTWVDRGIFPGFSGYPLSTSFQNSAVYDGTRFIIGTTGLPAVWWSTDGIDWKLRWLSTTPTTSHIVCAANNKLLVVPTVAGSACYYSTNFTVADYVGTGKTMWSGAQGVVSINSESSIGYVRIK